MNKELKLMEPKQYDDEIDLYEIIEILMKHRIIIIITAFIVILLSIFGAYYENKKSSKVTTFYVKEYFINRDSLKTNILDNSGNVIETTKGLIDPKKIFLKNDKVDSMFEIDELKSLYKGEINYNQKRNFLNNLFLISQNNIPGSENTVLVVKVQKNLKQKDLELLFNKYEENLKDSAIVLNSNKKINIYSLSDIYIEKIQGQSKGKLILVVGIVLGLFLGVMGAFFKEFIDGYKKRYKK